MVNVLTISSQAFHAYYRTTIPSRSSILEHMHALDEMDGDEMVLESECLGSLTGLVLAACELMASRPRLVMASCIRDLSRLNEEEYS